MKLLKIVLFCLVSNLSFGQYHLFLTNTSSNSACDGTAYFTNPFGPQNAGYSIWKKIEGNDTITIQEGGVSIDNLCEGIYIHKAMSFSGFFSAESKFFIKVNSDEPCGDFTISSVVKEPNSLFSNSFELVAEVINGSLPYTFYFDNILTDSNYYDCCSNQYYTEIGSHSIKVIDSLGCSDSLNIEIFELDTCRSYLSMGYNFSNETITNACDGSFQLIPSYITDSAYVANNIQVNWDTGQTGLILTDLCPGFNYCTVIIEAINPNQPSCLARGYIKIDDALDSVFVYGNIINQYDILYSEWTDECSIDLTAIQSAEIVDFNFITSDSILVTWNVRDTNQVVATVEAGYHLPNASENYNFVLQLYCLQKSFPVYAHTIDQQYIGELGILNSILEGVSIAPNPAESILQVKSEVDFDTYLISDMSGKIVKSQDYTSEINIEDLQSGIYMLHLHQYENVVLVKFVKK